MFFLFRYIYFKEMNKLAHSSAKTTMKMPALGRHFTLGSIYDASKDETIPGK